MTLTLKAAGQPDTARGLAYVSQSLARLDLDVLGLPVWERLYRRPVQEQRLRELFTRLEFTTLLARMDGPGDER